MKIITYSLVFVLVFLSIFAIGYLVTNNYIGFWNSPNTKGAAISRFVEPIEVKSLYDLLDRLPSTGSGPVVIDKDGQSLLYYNENTGYIHRINLASPQPQDETLQRLHSYLSNLQWSTDRSRLLANDGIENVLYNLTTGESRLLSKNIQFPVFSPSGDKISYIDYDLEQYTARLVVTDLDFESLKTLNVLAVGEWSLSWVDQNTLSLGYNNMGAWGLILVDVRNGQLTRILSNLTNLRTNWSRDGQLLLYSFLDKNNTQVLSYRSLTDTSSDTRLPIVAPSSKCVWSINSKTLFCAVNKNSGQSQEDDGFISLQIGEISQNLRINNSSKIKAENLLLSADEKYLFFRNVSDGNLYRLKIIPE